MLDKDRIFGCYEAVMVYFPAVIAPVPCIKAPLPRLKHNSLVRLFMILAQHSFGYVISQSYLQALRGRRKGAVNGRTRGGEVKHNRADSSDGWTKRAASTEMGYICA